jgi:regulatory protein
LIAAWLEPGKVLDQKQIDELVEKDSKEQTLQAALKLIDYRARTEKEVRDKLSKKGFESANIEDVISKLRENRMLADGEFAESWVENRNQFHPRSQRLMKYELRNKGIGEDQIEEALKNSAGDDALALMAANKVSNRFKELDWQEFQKKLMAYLLRKGFSYEVVIPTIKRVWLELQNDEK